jgi:transposase
MDKAYREAVWHQTTENVPACLQIASHYFGGDLKRRVLENLNAAAAHIDWYDQEVDPKLQPFAAHYGTVFLPSKPDTPTHNRKVESSVTYAKNNALTGRVFDSRTAQNATPANRETRVAVLRLHGTTKLQIGG